VLAGIHHGLTTGSDPGAPAVGNVSRQPDSALPFSLEEALARLRAASVLPSYFGGETLRLYADNKAVELERVKKIISPAEYDWYL
jgi:glutamine synthetase